MTEHDNTDSIRKELSLISCWLDDFAKDDNDGAYLCFLRVLAALRNCQAQIIEKMTDEQINAAIAEACGWTDFVVHSEFGLMGVEPNTHGLRTAVPWYVYDLNAMHEAEQHLWRKDWFMRYDYVDELGKLQNPHNWQRMEASDMLDATARQRAEAFLRTLGKWEENK